VALRDDVEAEGEIQWLNVVGTTLLGDMTRSTSRGHMGGDDRRS
jgi:hypothetical protein